MKRIYLSGPMTGLPGLNFPAFAAMTASLRARHDGVRHDAHVVRLTEMQHGHSATILKNPNTNRWSFL